MSTTVNTQFGLDKALKAKTPTIYIESPAGVWLTISNTGSSHVVAWGSSHVVASKFTAVHLWSQQVTLDAKGAVIDLTAINLDDPKQFIEYHGIQAGRGKAIVYKAVDDDLKAGHSYIPTLYAIGTTVTARDWRPSQACGNGLHFSPSPAAAKGYYEQATRFLAVEVKVAGMVALNDKVKVESAKVLYEVDLYGQKVSS